MSQPRKIRTQNERLARVALFAALADETRLMLVAQLANGEHHSIAELTEGSTLTRQAITKHLRVLEHAKIVHGVRRGREHRFAFDPKPLEQARGYLDQVAAQWDRALGRLKSFVEEGD